MPESVEMKGTENSQGREDDSGRNINDNEQVVDKWMESDVNQVKHLRPSDLKGLTKTSLEKTMQYSYRLRQRAKCEWLDADKILTIGSSLEEFATCLVEPLKYNKPKTAILAHNIDRVARNAVLYEQKKFLCHMVLYELLMRRWSGMFYSNRYSSKFTAGWFKWVLLNLWTICDMVLFPVVFFCLYLFHKIVTLLKDKQTYHVIFLLKKSTEHSIIDTFPIMQSVCIRTIDSFKPIRCSYACIIHKDNELLTHPFCNKRDIRVALQGKKSSMERSNPQDDGFIKAKELFSTCNNSSKKVLVIITDGSISTYSHDLPTGTEVIAVGIGENLCVEYLKNLTDKKENVILHHDDSKTVCQQISRCIYGRDMYDCYKEYFTTPYFIFFRDTFSYIILLGLHFAMCLQPSSLHFTSIEWIILLFFVGRFMMEVEQYVRLRNQLRSTQFTATSKYSSDPWNRMDVLTLLIYTVLLVLRATGWSMHGSVHKNRVLAISGYLYGLNAMIITLRVFGHMMENNAYLGAIQIALLQIIGSSLAIFGQFFAALIAFSLAITKVYVAEISYNSPANTTTSYGLCNVHGGISCWWSLTKYLAWSVLGFGGLESLQSEDGTSEGIVQALYALFLILSVVMLMNMMIALLSNTYQRVQDNAYYEWSYRKSVTIVTYLTHHPVPVPFNIVSLLFVLFRYLFRNCSKCNDTISVSSDNEQSFKRLVSYLEHEYITLYGNTFPSSDGSASNDSCEGKENVIQQLIKETDRTRQLVGRMTEKEFQQDWIEQHQLTNDTQYWATRGMSFIGQRLCYSDCLCDDCSRQPLPDHGARYRKALSNECPVFEILVQSLGSCSVSFGVVSEDYNLHKVPGIEGNTAGCQLFPDNTTLFCNGNHKNITTVDIVEYDVLGCELCYDRLNINGLPVVFTKNNKIVADVVVKSLDQFYPFISINEPGCVLHFRMSSRQPRELPTNHLHQIMQKMNDMSSNYLDLQRQFIKLQSKHSQLQSDHSSLRQGMMDVQRNKFQDCETPTTTS